MSWSTTADHEDECACDECNPCPCGHPECAQRDVPVCKCGEAHVRDHCNWRGFRDGYEHNCWSCHYEASEDGPGDSRVQS